MAKAKAICKCKMCDKEFAVTKILPKRAQADSWEVWAAEYYDLCPECCKAAQEAKKAEIVAKFLLPELHAVSEKQLSYATKVRTDYVCDNIETMRELVKTKEKLEDPTYRAKVSAKLEKEGKTIEQTLADVAAHPYYRKAYACLQEADAGKLLDTLLR